MSTKKILTTFSTAHTLSYSARHIARALSPCNWKVTMKKIMLMLCMLIGFTAYGEVQLDDITRERINDTLQASRKKVHDVDRNGEISCLDYAVTFYRQWAIWGTTTDDVKLIVNRNPNTLHGPYILNHIFMEIRFWSDITHQIEYFKLDSNSVKFGKIYTPAEVFGKLYDPAYDIRNEQKLWLSKAKY